MISPLPGVTAAKPGAAHACRFPASRPTSSMSGASRCPNGCGRLPGPHRAVAEHAAHHLGRRRAVRRDVLVALPGRYFAGDGAKKDEDGDFWLLGRVDDVMLVSGHNISTTEVESALVSHPSVAEAAVVGATDPTTGQGIVAFVIIRGGARRHRGRRVRPGAAQPRRPSDRRHRQARQIMVVSELPKTRSGKIMRRLLRDVAEHRELGDVTTLADPTVMGLIAAGLESSGED